MTGGIRASPVGCATAQFLAWILCCSDASCAHWGALGGGAGTPYICALFVCVGLSPWACTVTVPCVPVGAEGQGGWGLADLEEGAGAGARRPGSGSPLMSPLPGPAKTGLLSPLLTHLLPHCHCTKP